MGVKIKLTDQREVEGKTYAAGDVVEVTAPVGRVLVTTGVGTRVDARRKAVNDKPAGDVSAVKIAGDAGQKG